MVSPRADPGGRAAAAAGRRRRVRPPDHEPRRHGDAFLRAFCVYGRPPASGAAGEPQCVRLLCYNKPVPARYSSARIESSTGGHS
jgi:hypothetical protein